MKLLSQSGFSLVQGMVLSGVLAGSALMGTKMLEDLKQTQKAVEIRSQIEELHSVIYTALQSRADCTSTFLTLSSAQRASLDGGVSQPLNMIKTGSTELSRFSASPNAYLDGNVIIDDIQISYNNAAGTGQITLLYRSPKSALGSKSYRKTIDIRVQRDPFAAATSNLQNFVSCYAVASSKDNSAELGNDIIKELCESMNTSAKPVVVWDEANSTCKPNAKCPDHLIYTGIDTDGGVRCREAKDWVDFGSMIQPTSGTCFPGETARIEVVSTNPVRVRIRCQ